MSGGQSSSEAAERYAAAFFELALEAGALDEVARDLDALAGLLDESEDLRRLAESPAFSREEKLAGLQGVAERAGFAALTQRFLGVVAGNGRARALAGVIASFRAKVDEHRGLTVAEVEAATPLSEAQIADIAAALKKSIGREVEVRAAVRPELLGGLVVKVGSRMFDSSIRTKLDGLKSAMKGA